ncbi:MAG TPA: TIGR04551 family protein [Polyangiaceae bacterium]|nr:TIGR04551 family protein [Polyangiaceae bacterium]
MQTRFRPVLVALGSLLFANASLAQTPAAPPKPARPEAAPPAEATPPPTPAPADVAPAAAEPAPAELPPAAAPAAPPAANRPSLSPLPAFPEPSNDAGALTGMGRERPTAARKTDDTDVFAEDWWSHARPILELHGNFRVRAEMFYRFSLGRIDDPSQTLWPRPPDNPYTDAIGPTARYDASLCTYEESGRGASTDTQNLTRCKNNTQAGANIRFRLNPELHISDNLRVISQIDLLDNVVLGSTSSGYSVTPSQTGGYVNGSRSGYEPLGFSDQTTSPPRSGINSLRDSVHVKRAWAEYSTPVGEARFGRMPNHWGLGMVNHAGDGYDDDYQSTIDRIQFVAGIKPLELYIAGAWDFPNEGPTSETIGAPAAQPYDLAQLDDVDQYVLSVVKKKSPELTRLALSRGDLVINGGLQLTYRKQLLDLGVATVPCQTGAASVGCQLNSANTGESVYVRRDAHYYLPDLWLQVLYKQFRFEAEVATLQGSIGNISTTTAKPTANGKYTLASWGFVAELEQRLVENRLKLGFGTGWASGDADVDGLSPTGLTESGSAVQSQHGDHKISTFRFNPAYRVDLILNRNILSRVQGSYYFRPSLGYDFLRDPSGQRLGGTVAAIWTRASEFVQAPGHARDLGIELNGGVYFQSKDGALNDDPNRMGGFYARLEYGILFPMSGLGYPSAQASRINNQAGTTTAADVSTAQILRLYLGAMF